MHKWDILHITVPYTSLPLSRSTTGGSQRPSWPWSRVNGEAGRVETALGPWSAVRGWGVVRLGLHWAKESAVPSPNTATRHPDEVIPDFAYANDYAHSIPLLWSWVLDPSYRSEWQRCKRLSMGIIPCCCIPQTSSSTMVTALRSGLPPVLKGFGASWDARTERVAIENLSRRATYVV